MDHNPYRAQEYDILPSSEIRKQAYVDSHIVGNSKTHVNSRFAVQAHERRGRSARIDKKTQI